MNPYKILNVDADVTQKEIIQAVTRAMREKRYSGRELAQAQKMLLDPISGAAQRFLHCVDLRSVRKSLERIEAFESNRGPISDLTRLSIFDEDA